VLDSTTRNRCPDRSVTVDPSFRSVTTTETDTGDELEGGGGGEATEVEATDEAAEGETGDEATTRGDDAVEAGDVAAAEDTAVPDDVADADGPVPRA
jgi:hypothetical protein